MTENKAEKEMTIALEQFRRLKGRLIEFHTDEGFFGFLEKLKAFPARKVALHSIQRRIGALYLYRLALGESPNAGSYAEIAKMSEILDDDTSKYRLPKNVKAVYGGLRKEIEAYKVMNDLGITQNLESLDEKVFDSICDGKPSEDIRLDVDSLEWMANHSLPRESPKTKIYLDRVDGHDMVMHAETEMMGAGAI